jgi:hypothetical protein
VIFLRGDLRAKVVPERTTYHVTYGIPRRVPQASLQADSALTCCHEKEPQEPSRTREPRERDVERSAPTHACHIHCAPRQLGTTAQRYDVPRD